MIARVLGWLWLRLMPIQSLTVLCTTLRGQGVVRFRGYGLQVEFGPQSSVTADRRMVAAITDAVTPNQSPPQCPCGHPDASHSHESGMCLVAYCAERGLCK